jgi:CheY-like chemotaxis protein
VRTRKISDSRLAIEVSGDGPGIPAEISPRVFDPFFTTKPDGVGTGLGLAIVRRMAEQHEGKAIFENIPAGGTRFTIELPLLPVSVRESALAAIPAPASAKKTPPARILVVEDEPTVAQLVADVLREEGHDVEAVTDSREGLVRASRRRYDLIICDLRMPRMDGPAFYDALVRARSAAQHRILCIIGDTPGPHTVEFLKSHQLPFLTKPFLVEELKLAVTSLWSARDRTPEVEEEPGPYRHAGGKGARAAGSVRERGQLGSRNRHRIGFHGDGIPRRSRLARRDCAQRGRSARGNAPGGGGASLTAFGGGAGVVAPIGAGGPGCFRRSRLRQAFVRIRIGRGAFVERRLNSPKRYSPEFCSAWTADVPSDFFEIATK